MKGQLSQIVSLIHEYVHTHQHDYDRYGALRMSSLEADTFEKLAVYAVMQGMKGCINPRLAQQLVEMEISMQI
jgi:hypothetical protein